MRDEATNAALEVSISRERLGKYLAATAGDLNLAIGLYERNMRLSEAFYLPLQSLEICLRNHLNRHLCAGYGAAWLTDAASAPLDAHSRQMIDEARSETGSMSHVPGKIVAELKFAFWVGLLAPRYDATIWRGAAYRAFLAKGGQTRKTVHGRMNALRRFRNRVAHHEPVFEADPGRTHAEILEAIGWICARTQAWTKSESRVPEVIAAAR